MQHNKFILYFSKTGQILGIFGLLFCTNFLTAQCSFLAFNDTIEITVGATCEALIDKDVVLENDTSCPDDVTITLIDASGNPIGVGVNEVLLPSGNQGTTITIVVSHISGLNGSTTAEIFDTSAPIFTQCEADTISCTTPIDPAFIKPILLEDNCDATISTSFSDFNLGPNCSGGDFIYAIVRSYSAADASGNQSSCTQSILVERPDLSEVDFPADTMLNCGAIADVSVTGVPTLAGNPIENMGLCNFLVTMTDDTINVCLPGGYEILREWRVFNWCTNTEVIDFQSIAVEDMTAPILTCPSNLVVDTDANLCSATILLPQPTATDDCSNVTFSVNTSYGQTNFDIFSGVQKGSHTATYTATDGCGNSSNCSISVTVEDNETPTSVCDEITNVSLSSNGEAVVPASIFDDGSLDNCSSVFFEATRDGVFGPNVTFTCADVGNNVMVTVRVIETQNTASFIDCMVEVDVEDAVPPILSCPINMTVDCDNDFTDLSVFGEPSVFEACNPTISASAVYNLSNCGTGSITRTFTAVDASNNQTVCSQTITVNNTTPFDGSTIQFPADYTVENQCATPENLDPEDLPTGFNFPTYGTENCAMISTNYSDQLFQIEFPACYKIVRTWTVVDECIFDPDVPNSGGVWTAQQVLKSLDTEAPVLTNCPADLTVGVGNNCQFGEVIVPAATATDCSTNLEFSNSSPFAIGNGANISGPYPLGITTVNISVSDGCGNTALCQTSITVEDLSPPSPVCEDGLVIELQQMPGGIMAMAHYFALEAYTTDNCTSVDDLVFAIRMVGDTTPPTALTLNFDCDNIGINSVEIWATDEAGNSDFCQTFVEVQDNMEWCGPPLVAGSIYGEIDTEMGEMVEEVEVMIQSASNALPDVTGLAGSFAVPDLPLGQTYHVIPKKDVDHDNGVTTFDLVKISKHILGTELLDSPYKLIAADANNSGSVTTLDMVHIRKVILQIDDEFSANTSWRFIDKDHVFDDMGEVLNQDLPETITVENLSDAGAETDFYAVKIGDLNYSAETNNLLGADDRSFEGVLTLTTDNQYFEEGELMEVRFTSTDFQDIIGFQFSLQFDETKVEFLALEESDLPNLEKSNFGFNQLEKGILTSSWHSAENGVRLEENETIFTLKFAALTNGKVADILQINSVATQAEGYNLAEDLLAIQLQFSDEDTPQKEEFTLFQNQPNPFAERTEIGFYLPEASEVIVTVFDLSGKMLWSQTTYFQKGQQEIQIEGTDLVTSGVLYYRVETEFGSETRKMVRM